MPVVPVVSLSGPKSAPLFGVLAVPVFRPRLETVTKGAPPRLDQMSQATATAHLR